MNFFSEFRHKTLEIYIRNRDRIWKILSGPRVQSDNPYAMYTKIVLVFPLLNVNHKPSKIKEKILPVTMTSDTQKPGILKLITDIVSLILKS